MYDDDLCAYNPPKGGGGGGGGSEVWDQLSIGFGSHTLLNTFTSNMNVMCDIQDKCCRYCITECDV